MFGELRRCYARAKKLVLGGCRKFFFRYNPCTMVRVLYFGVLLLLLQTVQVVSAGASEKVRVGQSVVRVAVKKVYPDYTQPWEPGKVGSGVGSGFVIGGNRILTNAHVVAHAKFVTLTKQGDPKLYPASVEFIGHDCDLAMVKVGDESFFDGMEALELGGIPELESTVSVYGYPIGGDRLSVTQGVVSRIDFHSYSHTGTDSHLTIQIDAAINPGNSGGPVLQGGKVVGVAFQGFSGDVAQNVGYMIPTPVVARFLKDVEDGSYDRYMDLALTYYPLHNPAQRKGLGLEDMDTGVLVATVFGGGTTDGYVREGDVLMGIDGHRIASDGSVELGEENVELAEVVERKFLGESLKLDILRQGVPLSAEMPLKPFSGNIAARSYRERPEFVVFAGLVFQPVDEDLMHAYQPGHRRLKYLFESFLTDHVYKEYPELVVLSNILPDAVNTYASDFRYSILDEINGKKIRRLGDVVAALKEPADFYVFRFLGEGKPLVLEKAAVEEAEARIRQRYNVGDTQYLKQ